MKRAFSTVIKRERETFPELAFSNIYLPIVYKIATQDISQGIPECGGLIQGHHCVKTILNQPLSPSQDDSKKDCTRTTILHFQPQPEIMCAWLSPGHWNQPAGSGSWGGPLCLFPMALFLFPSQEGTEAPFPPDTYMPTWSWAYRVRGPESRFSSKQLTLIPLPVSTLPITDL